MQGVNYFLRANKVGNQQVHELFLPVITIGSAPTSSIVLDSGAADFRHCRIEKRDSNQFTIRDLRSSTGTFVNGAKIMEAFLYHGDIIRINQSTFEFVADELPLVSNSNLTLKSKNQKWNQSLTTVPSLAKTNLPVLILGPSGSGKELIARSVHQHSYLSKGPFVSVNCSALSENLVESELFGHIRGSFTGAINDRKGAFESARGGTLFLDEIGDLPYSLQAKLLRAIENNEVRAVGSDQIIKTNVRIIAATHQNVQQKIIERTFRADLFYRLNVITINVPSLLDRMEDFEEIFYQLCKEARVRFSISALEFLKRQPWPGNIRELKNVISRASAIYPSTTIQQEMLFGLVDSSPYDAGNQKTITQQIKTKSNLVKEMERQMILSRLIANHGNQRQTAIDLGIPKSTLYDRIKSYKIDIGKVISENTTAL
ncbi:MAG: hypothetical protein RJB66_2078 [Pseudomonadota bacterium]|jgi:DNA-binding NtrC family response regulator